MRALVTGLAALTIALPALAADLGGNCCSDLEERIAELEATTARKGNRKVTLTVYGQVNRAIAWHNIDDAPRAKRSVIDGAQSASRIGAIGSARINPDVSVGYKIEIGLGGFDEGTGASNRDLAIRYSVLHIKSKKIGTLSLGLQSMATDGITQVDLSNSQIASSTMSLAPFDNALLGVSLLPWDGTRADAVRYTSPTIAGFVLDAAWASDDNYDVALRWAGESGPMRAALGVGYREDNGPFGLVAGTKSYLGSGSAMHVPSGLFVSASYGRQKLEGLGNLDGYTVRGGVDRKFVELGKTTLFAEFMELRATDIDSKPRMFGIGAVQSIDAAAMDLYVSLKRVEIPGESDIDTVLVGARIKF